MSIFSFFRRNNGPNEAPSKRRESQPEVDELTIEGTISGLMDQDAESVARGEIPERRLIPHHAIKRDVIISAYTKDFNVALEQTEHLSWKESEKKKKIEEMQADFEKHIYGVKRLSQQELGQIIALMKKTRTDLKDLENTVRQYNSIYKIVDPL